MKGKKIQLSTILGKESKITGNLNIKGGLKIDGEIEGNITTDNIVIIGSTGKIKGNIQANECLVSGKVEGDLIISTSLEMETNSVVNGDISAKKLKIHSGATLNGMCKMTHKKKKK